MVARIGVATQEGLVVGRNVRGAEAVEHKAPF